MKIVEIRKQILAAAAVAGISGLVLVGCNNSPNEETAKADSDAAATEEKKTIVIGTTEGDFADMVRDQVKGELEAKGYTVKLTTFTDYVRPNLALAEGDLDINIFQHKPYLDT